VATISKTPASRAGGDPSLPDLQQVYDRLRALIVRGRLAPGARVSEAELAERLDTSRTPIRDAMRRLQIEGLLVPVGGGQRPRVAVAPVTGGAARELYHAAGALEGVAARAVVGHPAAARGQLAADLEACDAAFRRAASESSPDFDRLFELHDAFHRRLTDACAGPNVRTLLEVIRPQLDRLEWMYAPLLGLAFAPTYAEHQAIADAVRAGDADEVERAVRANWFNSAERLLTAVDRVGADGFARAVALAAVSGPPADTP
jgi:DNA-binding GntR family transcriptional regulator